MDPRKRDSAKRVPPKSAPSSPKMPTGRSALTVKRSPAPVAPEPTIKEPAAPSRRSYAVPLIVGGVLALALMAGMVVGVVLLRRSGSASEPALASLREIQHSWWTKEGF